MSPAEKLYVCLMDVAFKTTSRTRQQAVLAEAKLLWLHVPGLPYYPELEGGRL